MICHPEQIATNESEVNKNAKVYYGNLDASKLNQEIGQNPNLLNNLELITGDADFENSQITELFNLTTIGGSAFFENSQIKPDGFNQELRVGNAVSLSSKQTDLIDFFKNRCKDHCIAKPSKGFDRFL